VIADLLQRKRTHFVLWAPQAAAQAPALVIGEFVNTNPASLINERTLSLTAVSQADGLWALAASSAGLQSGAVYHYWFEVDDTKPGRPQANGSVSRIQPRSSWTGECAPRSWLRQTPTMTVSRQPSSGSTARS
jgi:hypothetical protein